MTPDQWPLDKFNSIEPEMLKLLATYRKNHTHQKELKLPIHELNWVNIVEGTYLTPVETETNSLCE